MKVVSPLNTNHNLKVILRFEITDTVVLELYNEETKENFIPTFTYIYADGYLTMNFDFDFVENQKFQIKITENSEVVYRGKLMVTSQNTQTFKASKDLYYYE